MNLVTIPIAAEAAAAKAANSATGGAGTPSANNKNKPTNQHKTKTSPKKESSDTEFKIRFLDQMERTFESSHEAVTKLIDTYLATKDPKHLQELANVIRFTEEDLVETLTNYLGVDHAAPYTAHVHHMAERLHKEIINITLSTEGSQRSERIYETVGGVYHVLLNSSLDIAENAYDSYIKIGTKEVE